MAVVLLAVGCSDDAKHDAGELGSDRDATSGNLRDASGNRDAGRSGSDAARPPSTITNLGNGDGGDGDTCASVNVQITRITPIVWLMIDGSGSMSAALNGLAGASRWDVLRNALLSDPSGLVSRLQASVQFGLFVYDGGLSPTGIKTDACPRVVQVPPALNNFTAIQTAYPATVLGASTPTHYALESLQTQITTEMPSAQTPVYIVLATDGRPNLCDFHDGIPATDATDQEELQTVTMLAQQGTKLFAISLAGDDADTEAHLNMVAAAGGTGQPAFTPTTADDLATALTNIIGGTTSCDVQVDGMIVDGHECSGDVSLNGNPLVCNDADGFVVGPDHRTITLQGSACDELRSQPSADLTASFSCGDLIVI